MIIIDCKQNSEQWFKEKLGKPSSSNASKILTNDGWPSKQRTGYLYELAGELATGRNEEGYQNANMLMGKEREEEAISFYEFTHRVKVQKVGVIYKDKSKLFLCSPDGIIKKKQGLEVKNVIPKTQVKYLLNGKLPIEYFSQIQFSLYVTDFKFWDFLSYVPGMKPLIIRVYRDKRFISLLEKELKNFCFELKQITKKVRK